MAAFQRGVIVRAKFYFQLDELVLRDAVLLDVTNDRIEFGQRGVAGEFGLVQDFGDHLCWAVVAEDVFDTAIDFDGDLLFEYEVAVHPPGAAAMEGLVEHSDRAPARCAARRNAVTGGRTRDGAEVCSDFAGARFGLLGSAGSASG